ncbi:cysteine proteinase [Whalleya microplaca]|nr:cysteine proteinase [Whalleya microplaca]
MGNPFKKLRPDNLGEPRPINILNGSSGSKSYARPAFSSPFRTHSSPPPAKRQKVDENTHTQAHFAPLTQIEEPVVPVTPRKRSFGSVSDSQPTLKSQSSNAKASQTNVNEYRHVERYTKGSHKKRARHRLSSAHMESRIPKKNGEGEAWGHDKAIDDSDEEPKEVDPETLAASQGREEVRRQQSHPIEHYGDRFRANRTPGTQLIFDTNAVKSRTVDAPEAKRKKQKLMDLSPDELALSEDESVPKIPPKRHVLPSSSISKKGDITPTKFTTSTHSKSQAPKKTQDVSPKDSGTEIIGSGLRVKYAVSGIFKYDANDKNSPDPCVLRLREISTILHPTDQNGDILKKYSYITVNSAKFLGIQYSSTSDPPMILITRSIEPTISCCGKLLIAFHSPQEHERFLKWVTVTTSVRNIPGLIRRINGEKIGRISVNLMTKATRNTVRTDDDSSVPEMGDDIKLIAHNAEARAEERKATNRQQLPDGRPKTKDAMRTAPAPMSRQSDDIFAFPDDTRQRNPERLARTTRSTFVPKSSSPELEPECWTENNRGWDIRWRNSLVYPPNGKSRAIVDKNDIPRLDEGQFLNDNLIIFYLRYLQHSLEADRPDLAQRIYFQNTFFYDRLKPEKSGQGISYDSVKAWTSKVDLFTKDYIIVPINEYTHWYVAIIYNAPKLLPSSDRTEADDAHPKNTITIEEDADDCRGAPRTSPHREIVAKPTDKEAVVSTAQNDVINHLSPINQERKSPGVPSTSHEDAAHLVEATDDPKADVERIPPPSDSLGRKKASKRHSVGARKHNLDQPRIITLDSLGGAHSPACSHLRQYLVAELKDKKGIEISSPGSLGMTAKRIPLQSNFCDCGLYVLGYIQKFLQDPDKFVCSILQHDDDIDWNLDPSVLRSNIRNLILGLQEDQQEYEEALDQKKKHEAALRKKKTTEARRPSQQTTPSTHSSPTEKHAPKTAKEKVVKSGDTASLNTPASVVPVQESGQPPSLPEMQSIPGSFPKSPVADNGKVSSRHFPRGTSSVRDETPQRFLSPLPDSPSSPRGSSRGKSVPIRDSEASQSKKQEDHGNHTDPQEANSSVEVTIPPLQSRKNQQEPRVEHENRKQTSTESEYFARRQRGDKMLGATLREEAPTPRHIIDISD